jgi:hypothetical protein
MSMGMRRGAVAVAAIGVVLVGCSNGSPKGSSGEAPLSGLEQVLHSARTVHCRGVWNYTNPQDHPSIDVHVTIGLGTWAMTSAGGTVATGTFKVSAGALTATIASVSATATDSGDWAPWLAKGSTLVVPGLPSGPKAPTTLDAIAVYRTTATTEYKGGPIISGAAAARTIGLRVQSTKGTTQILAGGSSGSPGQTITCTKQ